MIREDIIDLFRVPAGKAVRVKDHDPGWSQTEEMEALGKDEIKERARRPLDQNLADLAQAQDLLYADDRYSVLIVLQAMDAAGKDGTIKHVMSGPGRPVPERAAGPPVTSGRPTRRGGSRRMLDRQRSP